MLIKSFRIIKKFCSSVLSLSLLNFGGSSTRLDSKNLVENYSFFIYNLNQNIFSLSDHFLSPVIKIVCVNHGVSRCPSERPKSKRLVFVLLIVIMKRHHLTLSMIIYKKVLSLFIFSFVKPNCNFSEHFVKSTIIITCAPVVLCIFYEFLTKKYQFFKTKGIIYVCAPFVSIAAKK